MRNTIIMICLLIVLTASVVSADMWTTHLWTAVGNPPMADLSKWITVVTTATDMGAYWRWTYALTPWNVDDIRALTITLGNPEATMVTNVIGPANWSAGIESGGAVYWQTPGNGLYTLDSSESETFIYGFDHPWGPTEIHQASALDGSGYSGPVHGPAMSVPEPMSIVLGIMGLSSVVGFRKLRMK